MDPTFIVAKNLVVIRYEDIPAVVVEVVKKEVLDTLGVALAGSSCAGITELIEVIRSFGGNKQSTVIGNKLMVPAIFAAQINASMAHALDYDDSIDQAVAHPGAVIVPVCFALSESRGKITGREAIAAIALGGDFISRLGTATKYETNMAKAGWFYGSLHGYMTSAAVAGRLLKLDEDKMVNALGLAYQKTSGNQQAVIDGALSKRMGLGFAASGGILAALMAEKGITGAKNCIEGEYGLYNIYHRGGFNRDAFLQDIGKDFGIRNLSIKIYPSCRVTHPFIDAALALVKEHDIKAEDVKAITVFGGLSGYSLSTPLEVKTRPRTIVDSQFSVPWAVATAIVKRRFSVKDITEEAIKDEKVIDLAAKVNAQKSQDLVRKSLEPGKVEIVTTKDVHIKQVDYPSGSPQNPISFDECASKFRECASNSAYPLSKTIIENVIEQVSELDKLDDISVLIKPLG